MAHVITHPPGTAPETSIPGHVESDVELKGFVGFAAYREGSVDRVTRKDYAGSLVESVRSE